MLASYDSLRNSSEHERAEPQQSPVDLYTQYRLLHQPDQVTHFLHLASNTAQMPEYHETMAPVLEAAARHFGKFGVELGDNPLQTSQSVYGIRKNYDMLPTPDSIPVADISTCWDAIAVGDGIITVDYSLNGMWNASGDQDAATVLQHLHMYSSGSRDTKHRIITDIDPDLEEMMRSNFYGMLQKKDLRPEDRLEVGQQLGLQDILTKNMKVYWAYHGFGGNINAFDTLFRKWLANGRERGEKATFIAMEGLGANGSKAEKTYRDIYQLEPDRITIPRYGQQIYEAMLNSGIAGMQAIRKTYIGFSMGAAALSHGHDLMIGDEEQIRESTAVASVRARAVNGMTMAENYGEERKGNELKIHEPLRYFPNSSIFYFNPAYSGVTTLGGTISPDAPLRQKVRAKATQAVVRLGQLTGTERLRNIPGLPWVVGKAADVLMGGGEASPDRRASSELHGESIRRDDAVSYQESELNAYQGLTIEQVKRISRDNVPTATFIGNNDRITLADLQRRVIARQYAWLDAAGEQYIPHLVFDTPNGHGLLFDSIMEDGTVLLDVLSDLSPHDRMNIQVNHEWIELAINGNLPDYLYIEIAQMAARAEGSAFSRLCSSPDGHMNHIYPTLLTATPDAMKSPAYRARFVSEYIQLIRNRSRTQAPPPPLE